MKNLHYATGKRKTAIARVYITDAPEKLLVNKQPINEYFTVIRHRFTINQPFMLTNTAGRFGLIVNVKGGGISAQAQAIRHGIAKALVKEDAEKFKTTLKKAGLLTRDSRKKERKKYGQRGARARFQYSKR